MRRLHRAMRWRGERGRRCALVRTGGTGLSPLHLDEFVADLVIGLAHDPMDKHEALKHHLSAQRLTSVPDLP